MSTNSTFFQPSAAVWIGTRRKRGMPCACCCGALIWGWGTGPLPGRPGIMASVAMLTFSGIGFSSLADADALGGRDDLEPCRPVDRDRDRSVGSRAVQ